VRCNKRHPIRAKQNVRVRGAEYGQEDSLPGHIDTTPTHGTHNVQKERIHKTKSQSKKIEINGATL
jgi:hypothetical protein